ncbi:MAG: PhnD/SsuA/transferrin family substrate-binding protein [Methanosarcinales archaeon]|nr:PhnD/SsuA/transferrin family substrate-binding protein [Methanosarcinales archaeon]
MIEIYKFVEKSNKSKLLVFLFIITSILLSSCIDKQENIEIDFNKTTQELVRISPDDPDVVYFGFDFPENPQEEARMYAPFLLYLSKETGRTFKIYFTSRNETTEDNLGKGITQFATLDALSYIKAHDEYGITCITQSLNAKDSSNQIAVIVTQWDSNITELKDLRGKSFCFGSFDSAQGHIIPRKMLENATIRLLNLKHYVYLERHSYCAEAVMKGEYDAGVVDDTLAFSLVKEKKLRIIAVSDHYPNNGISANKDVDIELLEDVKQALLDFKPEGKHARNLTDWDKTKMAYGFIEANESNYTELRELAIRYGVIE